MFLPFFLPLFLQTSAISCMRLKFDYQMAVYELYEYGDYHVMNCYCVFSFLSLFLQTSAIYCMRLKFDYQLAAYEFYEYGDVLVMNCYYIVFSPFFLSLFLTDKCNILNEAEV